MFKSTWFKLLIAMLGLVLIALLLYRIPAVNRRLSWRLDIALTYLRGVIQPAGALPTPKSALPGVAPETRPTQTAISTPSPAPTLAITLPPSPSPTALPATPTPTALPESVSLPAPDWVKQDWNNCGPAALTMYLRYYGWGGDQYQISDLLKPARNDRNVNVEELDYYARNYAGWLDTRYRVGGNLELLRQLIAAGVPVLVEASMTFEGEYWPDDDLWAAHYLLVTGYDQTAGAFTVQDTFKGSNQVVAQELLDEQWQPFNRLYMLIYPPDQEALVKTILASAWEENLNRQQALAAAQAEIDADPQNAFAWFNLGTNLLYFERYEEAAAAYDQARTLGLPQRMLRYQFGPFFAYFHSGRIDELMTLTQYALQRTPNSEEALLWHGWGLYRQGDFNGAVADFRAALEVNPNNWDAQYALDFVLGQ